MMQEICDNRRDMIEEGACLVRGGRGDNNCL